MRIKYFLTAKKIIERDGDCSCPDISCSFCPAKKIELSFSTICSIEKNRKIGWFKNYIMENYREDEIGEIKITGIEPINKFDEHKRITEDMSSTYIKKNSDYGDSFSKSFSKYGPISAIVRMDDKLSRAHQLLCQHSERKVKDETVIDTLQDLANYAVMTIIELKIKKFEEKEYSKNVG